MWPIYDGFTKADDSRNYPIAAMVANLAKPTPNKPALMRHDDVVTFFHEMGHVFHHVLSKTRFSRFHGTRYVPAMSEQVCCRSYLRHGTYGLVVPLTSLRRRHKCWRTGKASTCILTVSAVKPDIYAC